MCDKQLSGDFSWDMMGSIDIGREHLGQQMLVLIYRLFQYTMRAVLVREYGTEEMIRLFRESGKLAGTEFAQNVLDLTLPLDQFTSQLQSVMRRLQIGVVRFEDFDEKRGSATLTIGEDLDCSGLPVTGECVCNYDEGFLSGVLSAYTKDKYTALEVDCWAKGDRVCRFEASRAD